MWNDILLLHKVSMTRKVNGLLYFLQKLPLIGSHMPSTVYRLFRLKQILSFFTLILSILVSIFKNLMYLFIFYLMPLAFLYEHGQSQTQNVFLLCFVLLSGGLGALNNSKLWNVDQDAYIMTRLLHMNAKRFLLHHAYYQYVLNTITLTLAAVLISLALRLPYWYGLLCGIMYLTSHITMDALYLKIYDATKHLLVLNNKYKLILIPVFSVLAYGIMASKLTITFGKELLWGYLILSLTACFFAIPYLKNSNSYKNILMPLLQDIASMNMLDTSKGDVLRQEVDLNEKDYSKDELKKGISTGKKGYTYMNELFFKRHKRLIYMPIKRRILSISAIIALLALISFFAKDIINETSLIKLLPPAVFLLYIINISEKICRAMFMNCDVSLLHYGYYRQPKAIFENFRIRLRTLSGYNLIITILLCLGIDLLAILYPVSFTWQTMLLFDLTLVVLSLFFSTHYLFVYYIFQPYNEQFDMKNPFMSLLNGLVYFLCYLCLKLDGSLLFAIGVLIATILYILISLLLVWRLAPKTFHLK